MNVKSVHVIAMRFCVKRSGSDTVEVTCPLGASLSLTSAVPRFHASISGSVLRLPRILRPSGPKTHFCQMPNPHSGAEAPYTLLVGSEFGCATARARSAYSGHSSDLSVGGYSAPASSKRSLLYT